MPIRHAMLFPKGCVHLPIETASHIFLNFRARLDSPLGGSVRYQCSTPSGKTSLFSWEWAIAGAKRTIKLSGANTRQINVFQVREGPRAFIFFSPCLCSRRLVSTENHSQKPQRKPCILAV